MVTDSFQNSTPITPPSIPSTPLLPLPPSTPPPPPTLSKTHIANRLIPRRLPNSGSAEGNTPAASARSGHERRRRRHHVLGPSRVHRIQVVDPAVIVLDRSLCLRVKHVHRLQLLKTKEELGSAGGGGGGGEDGMVEGTRGLSFLFHFESMVMESKLEGRRMPQIL